MCGLAINIASFAHLLKRVEFDAVVDYLAIVHIMKSKLEPASNRIEVIGDIELLFLQLVLHKRQRNGSK